MPKGLDKSPACHIRDRITMADCARFSSIGGFSYMSMDEEALRRRLAQAEARVTQGYRYLARQREIVRELQRDGRDAQEARSWLTQFEELHAIYVADRNRLLRQLSADAAGFTSLPQHG